MQINCQISSRKVDALNSVRNSISLIDRHCVGDTLSGVKHCTSGPSSCEETQNCLISHIEFWHFKFLEHHLNNFFSVFLWVEWRLGHHDFMFFCIHTEFSIENLMVQNLLKLVNVGDYSRLDRVGNIE